MYNVFVLTDDVSQEPEALGLPSIDSVSDKDCQEL